MIRDQRTAAAVAAAIGVAAVAVVGGGRFLLTRSEAGEVTLVSVADATEGFARSGRLIAEVQR